MPKRSELIQQKEILQTKIEELSRLEAGIATLKKNIQLLQSCTDLAVYTSTQPVAERQCVIDAPCRSHESGRIIKEATIQVLSEHLRIAEEQLKAAENA